MPAISDEDSGYFEKLGAKTETFLEKYFTIWGTYCANRPWLILFLGKSILFHPIIIKPMKLMNKLMCIHIYNLGLVFIVAMGHGIKYLNVTTDPVELWASPHSRSRVEREYFDSNFNPFYRIEQVINYYMYFKYIIIMNYNNFNINYI